MKRFLVVLVGLSAACTMPLATTGGGETAGTTTSTAPTTTIPPTTSHASPVTTTTVPIPVDRPPLAWLSPSGVPVAILETEGPLHRVLTPCGNEAPLVLGEPLYRTTVVIDPGHGGPVDTGAWGPYGLKEKDLNLEVSRTVEILLERRGISAILTRTDDYPTRLWVRSNLADALQAELMVSIHHNSPSAFPSSFPGTDVFVQSQSEESARLGGILWRRVTEAFSIVDVRWARAADSGVMTVLNTRGTDAYGMLRNPETPTALIEMGYMSNPSEAAFYASDIYPFYAAMALTNAIVEYLTTDEPGVELGPGRTFNPRPGISGSACVDPHLG